MTYKTLLQKLSNLSDEQLNQDVTVTLSRQEEVIPAGFSIVQDGGLFSDVLDVGHPVINANF